MKNKGARENPLNTTGNTSYSQQVNGEGVTRGDIVSQPLDLARMCEDSVAIVAAAYIHHSTSSDHLLYRVIQPLGSTSKQEEQMSYKSSSVTVSLHITSDDWYYFCSPGSVQRIIMNLVGNSLKYTSAGFINISLTSDFDQVVLRVSDSGKGISSEFLKSKLFSAFSQESSLAPGTGKD